MDRYASAFRNRLARWQLFSLPELPMHSDVTGRIEPFNGDALLTDQPLCARPRILFVRGPKEREQQKILDDPDREKGGGGPERESKPLP